MGENFSRFIYPIITGTSIFSFNIIVDWRGNMDILIQHCYGQKQHFYSTLLWTGTTSIFLFNINIYGKEQHRYFYSTILKAGTLTSLLYSVTGVHRSFYSTLLWGGRRVFYSTLLLLFFFFGGGGIDRSFYLTLLSKGRH